MNVVFVGVVVLVWGKLIVFLLEDYLLEKKIGLGKYEVGLDFVCMVIVGIIVLGFVKRILLGVFDFFFD